ncbi:MAG TPA: hypothetical protein VHY91_03920 [Pirellulales bacterium]|nr:hypothetical protein [Pirellulales bacterium]
MNRCGSTVTGIPGKYACMYSLSGILRGSLMAAILSRPRAIASTG